MAALSVLAGYSYDGHSLGWTGTVLVAVAVAVRVGWMLWRRRSRRGR